MRLRTSAAFLCAAMASFGAQVAHADPLLSSRGTVVQTPQGGLGSRSVLAARGERGAMVRRQGVAADGQGNAAGGAQSAFVTDSGAYGARSARFNRSSDGAVTASRQGSMSGTNGDAQRSGSFTRNADGTASGERSTAATNANTGVTFDGSTTYNRDTGVSRSGSCKDAAGETVACFSR